MVTIFEVIVTEVKKKKTHLHDFPIENRISIILLLRAQWLKNIMFKNVRPNDRTHLYEYTRGIER